MSPTGEISEPGSIGIIMEALSCRHGQSLSPFPALLSYQENRTGGRGLKIPTSESWRGLSGDQLSSRSSRRVALLE